MSPQQTTPNDIQDSAPGSTFIPWPRDGRTASNRNSGLQSNMDDDSSPQIASEHHSSHSLGGPSGNVDMVARSSSTFSITPLSSSSTGYSHITWATVPTASSGEQLNLGTSSSSSSSSRKQQAAATSTSRKSTKSSNSTRKRQRADEDEDVVAENKEGRGRAPPRGRPRTTTTNGQSAKRRQKTSAAASALSQPTSQVASASAPSSTTAITSAGTRRGATRSGAGRRTENPYPVIPPVHPTTLPTATGLPVSGQLIQPGTETSSAPNWAPPPAVPASIVGPSIDTQQARENPYPSPQLENSAVVSKADTTSCSAVGVHSQASSSGTFLDLQVSQSFDLPPVGQPSAALAHSHHQIQTKKQALNTYPAPPTTISTPMASTYPNPFDPVDLSGVPRENLMVFGRQAAKFLATYPGMRTRSVFSSADDMLQLHNQSPQVEPPRRPVINAAPRNQVRRNASGTAPDASLQDQP